MKKVSSINIIKFIDLFETGTKIYIIQELAEKGSLHNLLQTHKKFAEKDVV